jgi:hypothetical protein
MRNSENINELAAALSKAQAQMRPAAKDLANSHFKNRYSTITAVWEVVREPITANGLTIWQDITTCDKTVSVTTKVVHVSGQWVEFGPLTIPLAKFDAQGVGSATSYAKRYALCAALGVVSDDDDGEAASAPIRNKQEEPKRIGQEQIIKLNDMLEPCDEIYKVKFFDLLDKKYGQRSLAVIPVSDYENIARYIDQALKIKAEVTA